MKFETNQDRSKIIEDLKQIAKAWCFQKEKGGETGYVHWQMRLSLHTKRRGGELIKMLETLGWTDLHATPTSNTGRDSLYCMKADTRVEGPWSDKDKKPKYIQKRFQNPQLKPWQAKLEKLLVDMKNKRDVRHIVMVQDGGNEGKSWFKGYMMMHRDDVVVLPSTLERANEMIEFLCSLKEIEDGWNGIILMDVPRSTSKKHWYTLAAGLDVIKQGFLHDSRYHAKEKLIEPPQICCFMTDAPPEGCMTSDVFIFFDKTCDSPRLSVDSDLRRCNSTSLPTCSITSTTIASDE